MKAKKPRANYNRLVTLNEKDDEEERDIQNLERAKQERSRFSLLACAVCCAMIFLSATAALDYLRRRAQTRHAVTTAPVTAPTPRPMESPTVPDEAAGVRSGDAGDDEHDTVHSTAPTLRPTPPPMPSLTGIEALPTAAPTPRPTMPLTPSLTPLAELPTTAPTLRPTVLLMPSPTPLDELSTTAPTPRPTMRSVLSPTMSGPCPKGLMVQIQVENALTRSMGIIGDAYPWLGRNQTLCEVDDSPLIAMDVSMAMEIAAYSRRDVFGCSYEWHRDGAPIGDDRSTLTDVEIVERGAIVAFSVLETGCVDSSSSAVAEDAYASIRVIALTVRRELREYPLAEISRIMDAMQPMWTLTTSKGIERYGPNFRSVDDIDELHRRNAGAWDSDHFHEGVGFLTQHTKLSMYFEKSMRQIDPSVALPYWDATIDMELKRSGAIETLWDSPIFSELMFGSTLNTPVADLETTAFDEGGDAVWRQFAIPDGRWAFLANHLYTDLNKSISTPHNMYGRLRSPWNTNRSPYFTRFRYQEETLTELLQGGSTKRFEDLPVCEVHARFAGCTDIGTDFDQVMDESLPEPYYPNCENQDWWMRNVELIPHAKYHSFVAGWLQNTHAYDELSSSYVSQGLLRQDSTVPKMASDHKLRKMLWRCASSKPSCPND